mgnify:CR=1 FL=1
MVAMYVSIDATIDVTTVVMTVVKPIVTTLAIGVCRHAPSIASTECRPEPAQAGSNPASRSSSAVSNSGRPTTPE